MRPAAGQHQQGLVQNVLDHQPAAGEALDLFLAALGVEPVGIDLSLDDGQTL